LSRPGVVDDHTGLLVVRVWREPDGPGWRARSIRTLDVQSGDEETSTTSDVDEVCRLVRAWLEEFVAAEL